jgi:aryl-alcohol dehydrogenase-like predicted oxidoreductase
LLMDYRQLGNCGVRVSVIGLGTNRFGSKDVPQPEVDRIVGSALDAGVNFIDTANTYNDGASEETLGHALKGQMDRVVLASKFAFPKKDGPNTWGASRYQMMQAIEKSLRRLQADHLDLYYVHRWDDTTPVQETLRALDDLIHMGKVRYIGASACAAWQLAHANVLAELRGWTPFVVIQSEYNMIHRAVEREVLPYCRAHGVGFVPYYPLAGGFLTGKYQKGQPPPRGSRAEESNYVRGQLTEGNFALAEKFGEWANGRGHALNELAQAWLLAQPQVCSVITGAKNAQQLQSNVKSASWKLSREELAEIGAILQPPAAR